MNDSIVAGDEPVATGWEPNLPASDTLVRRAVMLHASWATAVAEALGRPTGRTDRWAAGFIGERGELTNPVFITQPLPDIEAYADVLAEVAEVIPVRCPCFLVSPFPTPDLSGLGLGLIGHPPIMARFPGGQAPALRDGVELVEIDDVGTLATAERVLVEGYPMPDLVPFEPGSILAPAILEGTTRVWLATVDGEPAAVAAAHVTGDAVLVEYVAALANARGRGAGAAVTWAATVCEPTLPTFLMASDDGRPLYERMGFVAIERWAAWLRPARA